MRTQLTCQERGRWVIDDLRGLPSPGRWCRTESVPTLHTQHYNTNPAAVLTENECDRPLGKLSFEELDSTIKSLWGSECVKPFSTRSYRKWLSYFIAYEQSTFGEVHAWFAAFSAWQFVFPYYEPERVQQLRFPDSYNTTRLIDGLPQQKLPRATLNDEQGNKIIDMHDSDLRPRRLWDVCANRIVPSTWYPVEGRTMVRPISHAWVNDDELEYVWTNVNQYLWPVPLPRGVTIEDIRADLVQLNVRYAWVDVLCLRQKMQPSPRCPAPPYEVSSDLLQRREEQRLLEWETDIPTIGMVYDLCGKVIVYLSGLGREFQPHGWTHPRHWLRRVWTLQETRDLHGMVFGGLRDKAMDPWNCVIDGRSTTLWQYLTKLLPQSNLEPKLDIGFLIREIQQREATNPVDRVASLVYLYRGTSGSQVTRPILPVYNPSESPEAAWVRLMRTIQEADVGISSFSDGRLRLELHLLMLFPNPGPEHWYPTWNQFMDFPELTYEPQLPDRTPPQANTPLILNSGRLYRGCTLHQVLDRFGEPASYSVTQANSVGESGSNLPWDGVRLGPTTAGGLPQISTDAGQTYVIIDITPTSIILRDSSLEPAWLCHILLICRELSPWIQPEDDPPERVRARIIGPTGNLVKEDRPRYLLRRVSTLQWMATSKTWLPVKECLGSRRVYEFEVGNGVGWIAQFDIYLQ